MSRLFRVYIEVIKILKDHPYKLVGLVVFSFIGTLVEGFGIAMVLPILEGTPINTERFGDIPLLPDFFEFINSLSLVERVRVAAVFLVMTFAIRSIFLAASQTLSSILMARSEGKIQRKIFRQVLDVQISYIHGEKQGNILEVLSRLTAQTGMMLQEALRVINSLIAVVAYIGVMMWISWQLTLITLILQVIITLLIRQRLASRIKALAVITRSLGMQVTSILVDSLSAVKLIHLFSREEYSQNKFNQVQNEYYAQFLRSDVLQKLGIPLYNFMNGLVIGALLIAGTIFLPDQTEYWLGQVILLIIIIFRLMNPAAQLNASNNRVSQLEPAFESVLSFLQRGDKPYLENGALVFSNLKEGIKFDNVTFSYEKEEIPAVYNVTFEIPHSKMTAVVGTSGSGKTTLVNLLARLYDPQSGKIIVDGVDLREFRIESWHKQIAVVSQDTFLFNASVLENLFFARPDAELEQIYRSTELAQAHTFIEKLPQKYETILGDRGVRLSGGQQQRIAIARALLVNPQLLILDEATSELDTETEKAIQSAIENFRISRTLLVIAHRLSTVMRADNIVVLSEGVLVEQGNHRALMEKGGHYQRLVRAQDFSE